MADVPKRTKPILLQIYRPSNHFPCGDDDDGGGGGGDKICMMVYDDDVRYTDGGW